MIFRIKDISWKEIALFTNDLSAIYKKTLSRRLDWNLILRIHRNVNSSFLFEEIFKNLFNSQSQYWKASVAKARFFRLRCLAIRLTNDMRWIMALARCQLICQSVSFIVMPESLYWIPQSSVSTILVTLSWGTLCCTHIPTKSCAPSLPVLIFLLDIPTCKNQHWAGRKYPYCSN